MIIDFGQTYQIHRPDYITFFTHHGRSIKCHWEAPVSSYLLREDRDMHLTFRSSKTGEKDTTVEQEVSDVAIRSHGLFSMPD